MTKFSICYREDGKHNEREPLDPKVEYIGPPPNANRNWLEKKDFGEAIFVEGIQSIVWNGDEVIIYVAKV